MMARLLVARRVLATVCVVITSFLTRSVSAYIDEIRGETGDAVIWSYILPNNHQKCYPTPDVCFTDIPTTDPQWLDAMPKPCPVGYEEAVFYTASEGVNVEFNANEVVREALNWFHGRSYGSIRQCNDRNLPFTFAKVRACVPEGSSCLPNGKFTVNTDVYYNLVTSSNELLGNAYDEGEHATWKQSAYPKNKYGQTVEVTSSVNYKRGPFYPGREYVFSSKGDAWKEQNQWRFEDAGGNNEYYLRNRLTGQYMGDKERKVDNASDHVGSSVLDRTNAIKVSIPNSCASDGTVEIDTPSGPFLKGMKNTLYFTSNDPYPADIFRDTNCYYFGTAPNCRDDEVEVDYQWCGAFGRKRVCKKTLPKPNQGNKMPLKIFLQEVTSHISPEKSDEESSLHQISKAVAVNSEKDVRTAAIESMAFQLSVEKSVDFFKEVYNSYKALPGKSKYANLKRSNAVADLSSLLDDFDLPDVHTASFRRQNARFFNKLDSAHSLKSSSRRIRSAIADSAEALAGPLSAGLGFFGGPALSLGLGLFSAWQEYETAKAYEERFRAIEQAIEDLAIKLDEKVAELCQGFSLDKYRDINTKTFWQYQKEVGQYRYTAFQIFDRIRKEEMVPASVTDGPSRWISHLKHRKSIFADNIGVFGDVQTGQCMANHEHADIKMDFLPMFAVGYIALLQEYFNLEMVMNTVYHPHYDETKIPLTCNEHYMPIVRDINDLNVTATNFRNAVVQHRTNNFGTDTEPPIKKSEEFGWGFNRDCDCMEYGTVHFTFSFDKVKDGEIYLVKARKGLDDSIKEKIISRRKEEVAWALDHFGKYHMDMMFTAFDKTKESLLGTCEIMFNDTSVRNDFIDVGLVMGASSMFDDRATCPSPPPLTNIALEKPTSQSSTSSSSSFAVDGVKGTKVDQHSSTQNEHDPWWKVDLLGTYSIREIIIYNIQKKDFIVNIFDRNNQVWTHKHSSATSPYRNYISVSSQGIIGTNVRISLLGQNTLQLMEVEVIGHQVIGPAPLAASQVGTKDKM